MENADSTEAISVLASAGFSVQSRGGRWWCRYPDGFDTEVLPGAALLPAPSTGGLVAALLAMAHRRTQALAIVEQAFGRAGWGLGRAGSGHWTLGRSGVTSTVDVGWPLTEALRRAPVRTALAQLYGGYVGFFFPPGGLDTVPDDDPCDNEALWHAHRQALADIDANAIEIGSGGGHDLGRDRKVEGLRAHARTRAVPASTPDPEAFAAWARTRLQQRVDLIAAGADAYLWRLREPLWLHRDDWLALDALVALCRVRVAAQPWDAYAAELLAMHDAQTGHAAALACWDRWQGEGGYDADGDDLAPYLVELRPKAHAVVLTLEAHPRRVRQALRAGFANALHEARARVEDAWALWTGVTALIPYEHDEDDPPDPAWVGFCNLLLALREAGPEGTTALLDSTEADTLRAAFRDFIAEPPQSAWAVLGDVLVVAARCEWGDVAEVLLASAAAQALVIDSMPGFEWSRPNLADGLLALSTLAPGAECVALAGRAWQSLPAGAHGDGEQDDALAVAIAWHRCTANPR